jgi:hypothetical protein
MPKLSSDGWFRRVSVLGADEFRLRRRYIWIFGVPLAYSTSVPALDQDMEVTIDVKPRRHAYLVYA